MSVLKLDNLTRLPLEGAGIRLFDQTGTQIREGYTDSKGILIFDRLPYGSYTCREFAAPDGYILNDTVFPFQIAEQGVVITHELTNTPNVGSIQIKKEDDAGSALPGVTFLLEYSLGENSSWQPVFNRLENEPVRPGSCTSLSLSNGMLTTDEMGIAAFMGLCLNAEGGPIRYRLTEIETKAGYQLLSGPAFEGSLPLEGNIDLQLTVVNKPVFKLPSAGSHGFWGMLVATAVAGLAASTLVIVAQRKSKTRRGRP